MTKHNPPGYKMHASLSIFQEIKNGVFEKEIVKVKLDNIDDLNLELRNSCNIITNECKDSGAFIDEAFNDFCSAWHSLCF
jgi:hypothetical protein